MEFHQTVFLDSYYPEPFADSLPITFNITDDTVTEGLEYFQARIVNTSDRFRVIIGQQDTVDVTIFDCELAIIIIVLHCIIMFMCMLFYTSALVVFSCLFCFETCYSM